VECDPDPLWKSSTRSPSSLKSLRRERSTATPMRAVGAAAAGPRHSDRPELHRRPHAGYRQDSPATYRGRSGRRPDRGRSADRDEAVKKRTSEELDGSVQVVLETDASGVVRRRTRTIKVISTLDGVTRTHTSVRTLERRRVAVD
jgi:hypothetical protein